MEHLVSIVRKELTELIRDQKFIAGLIVTVAMFPLLGAFMGGVFRSAREGGVVIGIIDKDGGSYAKVLREALSVNATIMDISELDEARSREIDAVVVIPQGFTKNLSEGRRGIIEVYAVLKGASLSAGIKASRAIRIIGAAGSMLSLKLVEGTGLDPTFLMRPISTHMLTIYKGRVISVNPAYITSIVMGQAATVPWVMFMLVIMTAQLAVTSMALEKENKTLEFLLSQPVSRTTILAGKLIAALVLALISAAVFFVGFSIYMAQVMPPEVSELTKVMGETSRLDLASVGLSPTPLSAGLMLLDVLLGLLAVMSLSLILGAATEDVRSAQSLFGIIIPLILLPALGLMFADIEMMPVPARVVIFIDPFSHPILAVRAAFENDYTTLAVSAGYLAIFSIAMLYVASKLFASERILTLRFGWRRSRLKR